MQWVPPIFSMEINRPTSKAINLHLVLRLIMNGAIPPFSTYLRGVKEYNVDTFTCRRISSEGTKRRLNTIDCKFWVIFTWALKTYHHVEYGSRETHAWNQNVWISILLCLTIISAVKYMIHSSQLRFEAFFDPINFTRATLEKTALRRVYQHFVQKSES
jgi:hypothetical protein